MREGPSPGRGRGPGPLLGHHRLGAEPGAVGVVAAQRGVVRGGGEAAQRLGVENFCRAPVSC
jgi:hypothetical protein